MATPLLENNFFFSGHVGIVTRADMPNFKSVALVFLELLTFNGQKCKVLELS